METKGEASAVATAIALITIIFLIILSSSEGDTIKPEEIANNTVNVNYDQTIEDLAQQAGGASLLYCYTDDDFPISERGTKDVSMGIIKFDRIMSMTEDINGIKQAGYELANFKECLSYKAQHPEIFSEHSPIIGIFSVKTSTGAMTKQFLVQGKLTVPCSNGDGCRATFNMTIGSLTPEYFVVKCRKK